jgi:hypothetical protein
MHAAVLATLPDTSARAYTLTVGGDDLNVTGQNGTAYLVPIDTIRVEEEGPGGISGMDFGVWDPNREVTITEGARVEFWDITNSLPLFTGFVQSWGMSGIVGRTHDVHCIGIEVVLDWMVLLSDMTFAALSDTAAALQALVANSSGIGISLRALSGTSNDGDQAEPLGDLGFVISSHKGVLLNAVTVTAGTTLREAIRQVTDENVDNVAGVKGVGDAVPKVTVDFWYGLRAWGSQPNDYVDLTVVDTVGAGIAATVLDHEMDAAGVPHAVLVIGTGAGSGYVGDGSGIAGPTAVINDSTITTSAKRDSVALAYLSEHGTATRGSLTIENLTPTTNIRPGSRVIITNTVVGLTAAPFVIASITKSFVANVQTWTIAYGGFRPSQVRQNRSRTRTFLS